MARELLLKSPVGFDPAVYFWPTENQENSGALEIIETVRWVYEDFPELNEHFAKEFISQYDNKCYESMQLFCTKYNQAMERVLENRRLFCPDHVLPSCRTSNTLLKHILQQAYNQAVVDPERLNQYEPFSPEVYGETSFEFIAQMVEKVVSQSEDVFIDLGSGVGQVVLQVAASTTAKLCVGIEKAEVPAAYAQAMSDAFKFWMGWYGKKYSDYRLLKGDFFADKYRDTINNAAFIFVNNFAFGPHVDHMLKLRFADLRDGARVVSSKAFCPLNFRITDRTLSDIGSIMHIEEIQPHKKRSVSWTGKPVSYYLHTIDRRKLEEFFMKMKNPRKNNSNNGDDGSRRRGKASSSQQINASGNDSSSNDCKYKEEDMAVYGPTTRKAWSEWCNTRLKENNNNNNNQNDSSVANANAQNDVPSSSSSTSFSNASNLTNKIEQNLPTESDSSDSTVETIITKEPEQLLSEPKPAFKTRPKRSITTAASNIQAGPELSPNDNDHVIGNDSIAESHIRKPGRPRTRPLSEKTKRLVNFNGLDLLHEQTVRSITTTPATVTPPGCIDQKLPPTPTDLKSFVNSHLTTDIHPLASNVLPNLNFVLEPQPTQICDQQNTNVLSAISDTIVANAETVGANLLVPTPVSQPPSIALKPIFDLDDLMFRFRGQITQFIKRMDDPVYHRSVETELDQERTRQQELQNKVMFLETQIREQLDRGLCLLQERLSELSIVASQPEQLVAHAKEIILRNRELHQQIGVLEQQILHAEQVVAKQQQSQHAQLTSQLQQNLLTPLDNQPKKSAVYEQMMEHKRKKLSANNRTRSESTTPNAFNAANMSATVQSLSSVRPADTVQTESLAPSMVVTKNVTNRNQSTTAAKSTTRGSGAPPKHRKSKNNNQSNNLPAVNCNGTDLSLTNGYSPQTKGVPASFPTPPSNASQDTPTNLFTTVNSPSLTSYSNSIKSMVSMNAPVEQQFTSTAHAAYQFPNYEDRIKNMIEAAMNDNSSNVSASTTKMQENISSKPSKEKVTKRSRGRAAKAAAQATESTSLLSSTTSISTNHLPQQKNLTAHSLQSSPQLINALSTTANSINTLPNNIVTTFNHLNNSNSIISSHNSLSTGTIDAQQSHPSQLQQPPPPPPSTNRTLSSINVAGGNGSTLNVSNRKYSAALEEPREGSALKLTLKIDRERDSYALVKSPPKSPDKQPNSKSSSPKRKQQNGSPEQSAKSRRCRSPKYSSSISTAGEHEGRLILKVTTTERPTADPSTGSYSTHQSQQQASSSLLHQLPSQQQQLQPQSHLSISNQTTTEGMPDLQTSLDTHNAMLYKQFKCLPNGFTPVSFATTAAVAKKR